jgi:hypothetical protein
VKGDRPNTGSDVPGAIRGIRKKEKEAGDKVDDEGEDKDKPELVEAGDERLGRFWNFV